MTITNLIISSMKDTALLAHTYVPVGNDTANNRSILIAKLNEAYGKCAMGYQILAEQGNSAGVVRVLDCFNNEIAPQFDKMLKECNK